MSPRPKSPAGAVRRWAVAIAWVVSIAWHGPVAATIVSFFSEVDPQPDVTVTGASYDYAHGIVAAGFNPSTDTITSASLTAYFRENSLATDDSVAIASGATLLGTASDPSGVSLDDFSAVLGVAPSLLQPGGSMPISLSTEGSATFQRSILQVQANRGTVSPPGPGATVLTLTDAFDPADVGLSGGFSFMRDIRSHGFAPATDTVLAAALTLFFLEPDNQSDDSVAVRFDALVFGGIVTDGAGIGPFQGTLGVAPSLLGDGLLGVTLSSSAALFDRALLEVSFSRRTEVPEPPSVLLAAAGLAAAFGVRRRQPAR